MMRKTLLRVAHDGGLIFNQHSFNYIGRINLKGTTVTTTNTIPLPIQKSQYLTGSLSLSKGFCIFHCVGVSYQVQSTRGPRSLQTLVFYQDHHFSVVVPWEEIRARPL